MGDKNRKQREFWTLNDKIQDGNDFIFFIQIKIQ